jgi:dsRNA-specific ribonuclease
LAILTSYIFVRYPEESEAFISRLRANLISNRVFATVSQQVGLPSWIRFSESTPPHVRTKADVHGDVYESFVGAMFRTQGFDFAYEWVVATFEEYVDVSSVVRGVVNPHERLSNACIAALGQKPVVETTRHSDGVCSVRVLHPVTTSLVGEACAQTAPQAVLLACDAAMKALVPTFPGSHPRGGERPLPGGQ